MVPMLSERPNDFRDARESDMKKERSKAKEGPKTDPGPTGQAKGTDGPARDLSKVPPQLRAHAHEPGDNGGVHRGPDLKPRLFFPSVYLKAFTDEGEVALPPASQRSGAQRRKRANALHALTLNAVKAFQGIGLDAAEGNARARDQLLRMVHDANEMLQPTKDEAKSGGGPVFSKFVSQKPREPQSSLPSALASDAAVIDANGTEYVEGPPPEDRH